MFDFQEYREKARKYIEAETIRQNAVEQINENDSRITVDYKYKTLTVKDTLNTSQIKEIEDEYGVRFSLGGRDVVKFDFREEIDIKSISDINMQSIRQAMEDTYNLYYNYFENIRTSMYQMTKIIGENMNITLSTQFWGFFIKAPVSICDDGFTIDEIMEIERETESIFINFDRTLGYEFHF